MPNRRLALKTWSGLRYYSVTVVGETKARCRVRVEQAVILPGRRTAWPGDVVLVPKFAVSHEPKPVQACAYEGHVYGYGDPTKPFSPDCPFDLARPKPPNPDETHSCL